MSSVAVGLAVAAIIAVLVCYTADIWLFFFGAILFAVFLRGLGDLLGKATGLRRGWSLALPVLAILIVAGLIAWLAENRFAPKFAVTSPSQVGGGRCGLSSRQTHAT